MITIIGVGALGSHAALFLRNEKVGLKVVDFDRVEMKNTQAQFHTKMAMGKNKVQSLQQSFQGLFGIKVDIVPHKLTTDNAMTIFASSDLVIDCTDNMEARRVIMETVKGTTIPCLHGALSAAGDFAQVIWTEHFKPDSESDEAGATCVDGEHLPFFSYAGAMLAMEAQSFLKTGKRRSFQLTPMSISRVA